MTNTTQEKSVEELQLTVQHYRERTAQLALEYEDKIAELRVNLTLVAGRAEKAEAELVELAQAKDQDVHNITSVSN